LTKEVMVDDKLVTLQIWDTGTAFPSFNLHLNLSLPRKTSQRINAVGPNPSRFLVDSLSFSSNR
jgi:hypothetical protein